MAQPSYSIYFTGRFADEQAHEARWAGLRQLFPHLTEPQLLQFFNGQPLLLVHGQPEAVAQQLAQVLGTHGLHCEVVQEAAPTQPHLGVAPHLLRSAQRAGRAEPEGELPSAYRPPGDEDALTPRGRRALLAAVVVVGALLAYAIWAASRGTSDIGTLATDGMAIPSICVIDQHANWWGGHRASALTCSATSPQGLYRLMLQCDGGELHAYLAFFDGNGRPRAAAWRGDGGKADPISYRIGDVNVLGRKLLATADPNVGLLPTLAPVEVAAMLAYGVSFSDIFADDTVAFHFDAAQWYVNNFISDCELPPAGG